MLFPRESLSLFSPAKVNLFFRVLHKREDGYHDIASLYQAISLGDTLTVSLAEEDRLTCDDPKIPCDEQNLISKALRVFREKTGYAFKVHFHVKKRIPVEAGLGGGSSNAATALFALKALSPHVLDEEILAKWACECGSDVSFFFSKGSAYCYGRGEEVALLPPLTSPLFWLAKPKEGLSTPSVYAHCSPHLCVNRDPQIFLQRALQGDLELFNDLENAAFLLMPSLSSLKKNLLKMGFAQVSMTGSGTAFICFLGKGFFEKNLYRNNIIEKLENAIDFFPTKFIQRAEGQWYEFPSVC